MKKLFTVLALSAIVASFFSSCKGNSAASSGSDSTAAVMKKNVQTALTADSVLMKHDIDGYFKLCAQGYSELGSAGDKPEKNIDSIKTEMKTFFGAYPDFTGEDLTAYSNNDGVIVTGTFSGTFKNPFMTMKPTDKAFKVSDADIYTFDKDGKITSHRSIVPSSVYMSQAGVVFPDKKK
jgi:predicted ester cyclase